MKKLLTKLIFGVLYPSSKKRKQKRKNYYDKLKNNIFLLHMEDGSVVEYPVIEGLNVEFCGENSRVEFYSPIRFEHSRITMGNNAQITIKKTKAYIRNLEVTKMAENCKIFIDEDVCINGCAMYTHDVKNNFITMGKDCLIAAKTVLWPTDGHTIYDINTGEVLNNKLGIEIGNHCWIANSAHVLKNIKLEDNTIVGAHSVVSKSFNEKNIIIAGNPARIIKRNTNWDIRSTDYCIDAQNTISFIK